ncbi:MAG: branched-chain amino acid ABC transporter permease [Alphaproteobacteria bacterium]|nr:branched-chain amino acid ABC transporter permease [Alphaproteobacteria bacterium]
MLAEGIRAHRWWIVAAAVGFAVLLTAPAYLTPFQVRVGQLFLFSAGLGVAWTILGGFAGYWSFGHTAFIGLGAFVAGAFELHVPLGSPVATMVAGTALGSLACAAVSAVIAYPILRLRGIYFAIAMLGVSQVFAELTNNVDAFKGTMGINMPNAVPASMEPQTFFYYVFVAATALTLGVAFWVKVSRLGYGLVSIREDEDTARMLGVPTERYKIWAFVLSATLTGLLGIVYAHALGYITTGSVYRTDFSLNMIVYALLGGIGTIVGPVLGSALMVWLTQVVLGRLLDVHMFITGALLVAIVLLAPHGLVGFARKLLRRGAGGGA